MRASGSACLRESNLAPRKTVEEVSRVADCTRQLAVARDHRNSSVLAALVWVAVAGRLSGCVGVLGCVWGCVGVLGLLGCWVVVRFCVFLCVCVRFYVRYGK